MAIRIILTRIKFHDHLRIYTFTGFNSIWQADYLGAHFFWFKIDPSRYLA
jgi:hypothetical protein